MSKLIKYYFRTRRLSLLCANIFYYSKKSIIKDYDIDYHVIGNRIKTEKYPD